MIIYIILLVNLLVGVINEQIIKNKILNKIIFCFNYLFLFLIASLRYRVSVDYILYENIYNQIKVLDNTKELKQIQVEKGYLYLNYIFAKNGVDFKIFIFLLHVILFVMLYKILKNERNKNLGLFMYYCLYYLVNNFNTLRQGISEILFLYSLKFIVTKKWKNYLFFNLIGLIFHRVSFLSFIIYPIVKKKLKIRSYISLLLISIIYSSFFIDGKIIKFLNENFNNFEFIRRVYYYYFIKSNGVFGGNSIVGYIYRIVLFIQAIFLLKNTKEKEKYDVIIANLVIYSVGIYFLLSNVGVLAGRISKFYQCASVLLGIRLIQNIQNFRYKLIFIIFIIFYNILFFIKELNDIHPLTKEKYYYPYRNIFMKGGS